MSQPPREQRDGPRGKRLFPEPLPLKKAHHGAFSKPQEYSGVPSPVGDGVFFPVPSDPVRRLPKSVTLN